MEQRISANHKILEGIEKSEAENNYLEHAMKIPLYGVYFFKSKDSTGKDIDLGIMSLGVIVYQNDHVVNEFSWSKMVKISFKRRTFFIELKRELVGELGGGGASRRVFAILQICIDKNNNNNNKIEMF